MTMPMVLSPTAQAIRAAASPQSAWRCSRDGGRSRPNGMRANPNLVTTVSIMSFLLFFGCRAAVDGGELLLGVVEVAGQGGRAGARVGDEEPGAADGGGGLGAVVAAEPPGGEGAASQRPTWARSCGRQAAASDSSPSSP